MLLNNELTQREVDLKKKYPWIGDRRVLIPKGWFDLLANACHEIEAVTSPDDPKDKFKYFFATVRDYKLQLFLQYELEGKSNAKKLAVESLIEEMRSLSEFVCVNCGSKLTSKSHKYNELPNCGCALPVEQKEEQEDFAIVKTLQGNIIVEQVTASEVTNENAESSETINQTQDKSTNCIDVFDINIANKLLADVNNVYRDKDDANKVKTALNKLLKIGPSKIIKPIPPVLDMLEQNFPNFKEVTEMLKGIQALSNDTSMPKIPPTLLLGSPGLGKTMFAQALADSMEVPFRVMRMENQQGSAGLVGTADFWSNSKAGLVFNILTKENCVNPIVVLDEVDKANVNAQYNPLNSLYNLLESTSAKSFNDESLPDLPLDASKITWILTANSEESIPEAILSRVRVFKIPKPNLEQARTITARIYSGILNESDLLKSKFDSTLSDEVINHLAHLSPRRIKLSIETGLGKAAIAKRNRLLIEDFDIKRNVVEKKIGFI
jgi:ATP-dependent Lon protease